MTSLTHIRRAIEQFSPDDFPAEFYRFPPKEAVASFQEAVKSGKPHNIPNPYGNKCAAYSSAFHEHFRALGIPNLYVASELHSFLLIPVDTATGTQFYFFDPTIQQFYPTHKEPRFLGSKAELEEFAQRAPTPLNGQVSFQELYFKNYHVVNTGGFVFEKGCVPPSATETCPPDALSLLDGSETLEQRRLKYVQTQYGESLTPETSDREMNRSAEWDARTSDIRKKIHERVTKMEGSFQGRARGKPRRIAWFDF